MNCPYGMQRESTGRVAARAPDDSAEVPPSLDVHHYSLMTSFEISLRTAFAVDIGGEFDQQAPHPAVCGVVLQQR